MTDHVLALHPAFCYWIRPRPLRFHLAPSYFYVLTHYFPSPQRHQARQHHSQVSITPSRVHAAKLAVCAVYIIPLLAALSAVRSPPLPVRPRRRLSQLTRGTAPLSRFSDMDLVMMEFQGREMRPCEVCLYVCARAYVRWCACARLRRSEPLSRGYVYARVALSVCVCARARGCVAVCERQCACVRVHQEYPLRAASERRRQGPTPRQGNSENSD